MKEKDDRKKELLQSIVRQKELLVGSITDHLTFADADADADAVDDADADDDDDVDNDDC